MYNFNIVSNPLTDYSYDTKGEPANYRANPITEEHLKTAIKYNKIFDANYAQKENAIDEYLAEYNKAIINMGKI